MSKDLNPKCKQCRREGIKLFLKGDKCYTQKCPIVKRNYPPGLHGPKGRGRTTGYGLQLREKQKAKRIFGILETQFRNYFEKAINKTGDTGDTFYKLLKMRLDNVVYEAGFSKSRKQARQLVSHGHILVNDKKVNIPSYQLKANDKITLKKKSLESKFVKDLTAKIEKYEVPAWIYLEKKNLEAKILELPSYDAKTAPFSMKLIIEFYSR